jgi:hypothetical protein
LKEKTMGKRKPKYTVRIHHTDLEFSDEGIFIRQGQKRYEAKVKEIDDVEFFVVTSSLGHKVYIEIDYSEK